MFSSGSESHLDDSQREAQESFRLYVPALSGYADRRFNQCLETWRDQNRKLAKKIQRGILGFSERCKGVADDIGSISTASGTVDPRNGAVYLRQEIRRNRFRDWLKQWRAEQECLRGEGHAASGFPASQEDRLDTDEYSIQEDVDRNLRLGISELCLEEECLRAIAILKSAREKTGCIRIIEWTSTAVASTLQLLNPIAGCAAEGLHAGTTYATSRYERELSGPQLQALQIAMNFYNKDRQMFLVLLNEAGIMEGPEDFLGLT